MTELVSLLILILATGAAAGLLLWLGAQLPLRRPIRRAAAAAAIATVAIVFLAGALPLAGVRV